MRPEVVLPGTTSARWFRHGGLTRVTSKGQVTIPRGIRRRLGVEAGSEVDFLVDDEGVRLVRRSSDDGEAIVNQMRGRRLTMTSDEIMALTRGAS